MITLGNDIQVLYVTIDTNSTFAFFGKIFRELTGDSFDKGGATSSANLVLTAAVTYDNIFRWIFSEIAKVHYEMTINHYVMTRKEH